MLSVEQQDKLIDLTKTILSTETKYVLGANPEKAPYECDCSSLTQYLYKQIGIEIPRSSILQAADANATEVDLDKKLQVGDVLFMRGVRGFYRDDLFPGREVYIGHVALYLGENKAIHAKSTAGKVVVQNLDEVVSDTKFKIVLVKRY